MEKWEMEHQLVDTIRCQWNLDLAKDPRLAAMCMLSEYLCSLKKIRTSGSCDEPQLNPAVWQHLNMDKTALVEVLSVINDEVENARQLLLIAA